MASHWSQRRQLSVAEVNFQTPMILRIDSATTTSPYTFRILRTSEVAWKGFTTRRQKTTYPLQVFWLPRISALGLN
ncbi:hypothetical protein Plhal304r1_c091g0171661 [Plasmopara halstedii]